MRTKVSIVILENEDTTSFDKSLDAVLGQTYSTLEVICIARKKETLDSLHHKDNRIKILDYTESEIDTCYNSAIKIATGKFIIFLDSKCHLELNAIEKMVAIADQNNAQVVVSEFYNIGNKPLKKLFHIPYATFEGKKTCSLRNQKDLYLFILPGLFNKLIQLDLIKKNNILLDGEKGYFGYMSFLFLCLTYADRVCFLNDYLFYCYYSINVQDGRFQPQLIKELDSLYYQLENRKINNAIETYLGTALLFLKSIATETSFEHVGDKLHQVKENLSLKVFNHIFCPSGDVFCHCVSIIIPVYNVEKYLKRCLDSAINQTLEDIEIICIDDNSDDNSLKILKEYERKDKRITIIHQENQGPAIARNRGLCVAAGEYVQFLDADDYLELNACELLYLYSKLLDLDMCSLCTYLHYGNKIQEPWTAPNYFLKNLPEKMPVIYNKKDLGNLAAHMCFAPWATFYNRRFLLKYNIHYINKKIFYGEDFPFFIMALMKAGKMGAFTSPLYHYCRPENGGLTSAFLYKTLTGNPTYSIQYGLDILNEFGEENLFNIYCNHFINVFLDSMKRMNDQNRKYIEKYVYNFFLYLLLNYHYVLPKLAYSWCLTYLKKKPILRLKFLFYSYYNKIRKNYLSKIITYRIMPSFEVINFLGLPIGYKETKVMPKEKLTKIVLFRITFLKIREEL